MKPPLTVQRGVKRDSQSQGGEKGEEEEEQESVLNKLFLPAKKEKGEEAQGEGKEGPEEAPQVDEPR